MKANELMLADWVNIINTGHAQVVMVDQYHIQTTYAKYLIDERKLEPIPITIEILEANGFCKAPKDELGNIDKPDVWVYEKEDKVIVIGLKEGEFASFEIYNDRRYASFTDRLCGVSELQHAMRLMGLNDMADNFKVKKGGRQ